MLDGQAEEVAVSHFDPAMLNLNRTVKGLDGGVLGIDDDDPRKASQTLLAKSRLDLADEIVDAASLVISGPTEQKRSSPNDRERLRA